MAFVTPAPGALLRGPSRRAVSGASRRLRAAPRARARRAPRCCVESPAWKSVPVDIDFAKDDELAVLETALDDAVAVQDFAAASSLRDRLQRLQSAAYVAVLSANLMFYTAFERASIVDMAGVWLQDAGVACKHPMGPLCVGYVEVLNSFGAFFSYGVPHIAPKNVVITMRGACAWATCDEHCFVVQDIERLTEDGKTVVETKTSEVVMTATNIFVKRNGQWYLSHHSSMPIS